MRDLDEAGFVVIESNGKRILIKKDLVDIMREKSYSVTASSELASYHAEPYNVFKSHVVTMNGSFVRRMALRANGSTNVRVLFARTVYLGSRLNSASQSTYQEWL